MTEDEQRKYPHLAAVLAEPQPEPDALMQALGNVVDAARGAMQDLLESMAPIRETVKGYRAALEADEWSEAEARVMAVEFHAYMLRMMAPVK